MAGCAPPPEPPTPEPVPEIAETAVEPAQDNVEVKEPIVAQPDPEPPVPEESRNAVSFGLADEEQVIDLDDPWQLVEQANSLLPDRAIGLKIRAIEEFLDQGRVKAAAIILDTLVLDDRSPDDQVRIEILRSRVMLAQDNPERALTELQKVDFGLVRNQSLRLTYLKTLVIAQKANELDLDATASLIELHDLSDSQAQLSLQQQIVENIRALNSLDRSLLAGQSIHSSTSGWLALAEALDFGNPDFLYSDFMDWRKIYPEHPATLDALARTHELYDQTDYKQIALLLPLSSDFGSAAQAFYDGFMDAASRYQSSSQPDVVLYDIGNSPSLSRIYYQAAINDGADFIIGPLGRKAANTLLTEFSGEVDTLMITDISEQASSPRLFAISLSPEEEAKLVAKKAWEDGYRQAAVFKTYNRWGERVADAFIEQFESIGGIVVKNEPFPPDLVDYSAIIKKYLGIDKSIQRREALEAVVDHRLKFTPRRNEDMGFIFLAANSMQARTVVPQLRFYQAHDLPVYATSYVYSGIPSPELDADLNEVVFPDMRWMLQGADLYRQAMAERMRQRSNTDQEASESAKNEKLATGPENSLAHMASGPVQESDVRQQDIFDPASEIQVATTSDQAFDATDETPVFETDERATAEDLGHDAPAPVTENLAPYRNTGLDRVYALGLQSYLLVPRLNALRNDPAIEYSGPAMTLRLSEYGEVVRQPVWLAFRNGVPELQRSLGEN